MLAPALQAIVDSLASLVLGPTGRAARLHDDELANAILADLRWSPQTTAQDFMSPSMSCRARP